MTPEEDSYGTDAHPEVTELSDLTEGLLSVSRAHEVKAHLAACPLCADVHDSLREIRGALGSLPGPGRMPDDVAGRIDAALAAEALLETHRPAPVSRETSPGDAASVSRETELETPHRRPGASRPGGPSGARRPRPGGSSGPGRPGPGRGGSRRHRRLHTLLTTAGVVGALVLGGALFQGLGGDSSGAGSTAAEDRHDDREAGALADEDLQERVQTLLDKHPAAAHTGPGTAPETEQPQDTAPLMGGPTTVPSCVRAGIDRPEQPLAAEAGQAYQGRPSYLVLLPHPGDRQRVDAYVVDASCTADPGAGPGEVLVQRTYARD